MNVPAAITDNILAWLLSSTFQVSFLILLVLVARGIFQRWLSPPWRHFLWFLVVARMLIPFSYESTLRWPDPRPAIVSHLEAKEMAPPVHHPAPPEQAASAPIISSLEVRNGPERQGHPYIGLLLLWLAGVLFLALRILWGTLRFARRIAGEQTSSDPALLGILQSAKDQLGMHRQVRLMVTGKVSTPILCGYFRPRLLLPEETPGKFSGTELRLIFLHELGHIKRHDIAVNWLTSFLQVLHWFNPLVWIAFQQMRADRELACDYLVLSRVRDDETIPYGETILKVLHNFSGQMPLPGLAGILEYRKQIKGRIIMIRNFRRGRETLIAGTILAAALALFTFTTPARLKAVSAPAEQAEPVASLLGTWVNTDAKSRSFQKVIFGEVAGEFYMDGWDGPVEKLVQRDRIYIPLDRAGFLAGKTFSSTHDFGFSKVVFTFALDGDLFQLSQKHTYTDPGRQSVEASAVYAREGQARANVLHKGLLGSWSNMFADSRYTRELEIRGGEDGVFLILAGMSVQLPLARSQAENFQNGSLEFTRTSLGEKRAMTINLKDGVLTVKERGKSIAVEEKYLAR